MICCKKCEKAYTSKEEIETNVMTPFNKTHFKFKTVKNSLETFIT